MSALTEDVLHHVHFMHAEVPAAERARSHWVMSAEWLNEVRQADLASQHGMYWTGLGRDWAAPETLLGLPVEVREDGGVPHLEPL
jgi:hypothetical protein